MRGIKYSTDTLKYSTGTLKYSTGRLTSFSVDLKQMVMEHASLSYCMNIIQSSEDMHFDQKKKKGMGR